MFVARVPGFRGSETSGDFPLHRRGGESHGFHVGWGARSGLTKRNGMSGDETNIDAVLRMIESALDESGDEWIPRQPEFTRPGFDQSDRFVDVGHGGPYRDEVRQADAGCHHEHDDKRKQPRCSRGAKQPGKGKQESRQNKLIALE